MLTNWNIAEILMVISIIINLFILMISISKYMSDKVFHANVDRLLYDIDQK